MESTVDQYRNALVTSAGAASLQGTQRARNSDAFLIDECLNMFVVADGVPDSREAALGSGIACSQILDVLETALQKVATSTPIDRHEEILAAIRNSFAAADRRILCEQTIEPLLSKFTLRSLLALVDVPPNPFKAGRLYIGDIAGCHALLIRDGLATQLSSNRPLSAELVEKAVKQGATDNVTCIVVDVLA